ncbi:uncharacterized protein FTOL_12195 [Fusarium torulosum]|uniref:Uncharacterized protein n=1 Tax=Fusarium torulosum TaxID=33205 RepID=A0AAE8SNL5_9HYPO|nr:uncharacterized protein FTOL_12195 [Fusarium torulosum]
MAHLLSFKDFAGALNRLRNGLKYYNGGEEQDLDDLINTVSELGDELMIMRDWTCLANEFRKGEHKAHRTKRLNEYAKVMIKENNRPQEERKPFAKLRNASILTNILVATASESKRIKELSETLVKYIINEGDTFIQARQLGPYFVYLPYCQILCLNEKHSERIEIWGEEKLSKFKTQCVETGAMDKKTKKRKYESDDATTELQMAGGSVVTGCMSPFLNFTC